MLHGEKDPIGLSGVETLIAEKTAKNEIIDVSMPYEIGSFRSSYYRLPSPIDVDGKTYRHIILTRLDPAVVEDKDVVDANMEYMMGAVGGKHNEALQAAGIDIGPEEEIAYINLNFPSGDDKRAATMNFRQAFAFGTQAFSQIVATRFRASKRQRKLLVGNICVTEVERGDSDKNIRNMEKMLRAARMEYNISSISCEQVEKGITLDELIVTVLTGQAPSHTVVNSAAYVPYKGMPEKPPKTE